MHVGDQRRSSSRLCTRSKVVAPFSCGWMSIESTPSGTAAQMVQAAVAGDPVEPRPRVDLPPVGEHRLVRGDEYLLEHVLGVLRRADHVPAEGQQARLVAVEEDLEGALVPVADQRDQLLVCLQAQQRRASRKDTAGTPLVVRADVSITRFLARTRYTPEVSYQVLRNLYRGDSAIAAGRSGRVPEHARDLRHGPVPGEGFEPASPCGQPFLRRPCIPVPPPRRRFINPTGASAELRRPPRPGPCRARRRRSRAKHYSLVEVYYVSN